MFKARKGGIAFEERPGHDPGGRIIEAVGVQKIYASGEVRVHALRGVDLAIQRGEMVAIMGPSGCGKTTLLNTLSGLDDVDGGDVYLAREPISGMSDRKRTRFRAEKMGFIFQSYNLIPVLAAIENVELPLLVAGVKPKKARVRAADALERVGLVVSSPPQSGPSTRTRGGSPAASTSAPTRAIPPPSPTCKRRSGTQKA